MDFSKLDDKRVFVTGAADGIGAALARSFKAGGARVFLSDIAEERLRETAGSLGSPSLACDVTNPTSLARVVERAWRELGGIDLVCANAGVVMQGPILETSREDLDWIFNINVWGCLNTCRPFVRLLRENKKQGHILLPGSLAEAVDEMEKSELVHAALGEHLFEWFIKNKRAEWTAYKTHVSQFELERYLPSL